MTAASIVDGASRGTLFAHGVVIWILMALAETIHGTLRNLFITPVIGDHLARQVGVLIGSMIILAIAWLFVTWIGATTTSQLLAIGGLWVVLMLTFEIGLGRALGASWQRILSDYDPTQGGLMPIGMCVILLAPLLAARARAATAP